VDIETRRYGHGDMDIDIKTWTWRPGHGHGDMGMQTWRHGIRIFGDFDVL
jgi:hypothetical protein